jgi:hypothetical protein
MGDQSEAVNKRTDNVTKKGKKDKQKTTTDKTLHRKLKIEQHEPL